MIVFPEGSNSAKQKTKRVRTTFTEDQIQVLQANFQLDSNPDGQDLERIAQITGLSKRVTQVWFQNSRARQKKHQQNHQNKMNNLVTTTEPTRQRMTSASPDMTSMTSLTTVANQNVTYSNHINNVSSLVVSMGEGLEPMNMSNTSSLVPTSPDSVDDYGEEDDYHLDLKTALVY